MRNRRHRTAGRFYRTTKFLQRLERANVELLRNLPGPFPVLIQDTHQLDTGHFPIHAHVIAAEFAAADYGQTHLLSWIHTATRAHSWFIPENSVFSSSSAGTATACIAIPAASATSNSFARSNSSVRSASTLRAVAPACFIASTVGRPTTGTSNRMSCFGLLTLTTTRGFPPAKRAARAA